MCRLDISVKFRAYFEWILRSFDELSGEFFRVSSFQVFEFSVRDLQSFCMGLWGWVQVLHYSFPGSLRVVLKTLDWDSWDIFLYELLWFMKIDRGRALLRNFKVSAFSVETLLQPFFQYQAILDPLLPHFRPLTPGCEFWQKSQI